MKDDQKQFTKKEKQVIKLVCEGLINKEIADIMCISIFTVKSHVHNIYMKLNVKNRVQLVNASRKLKEK